jgi:hypothetical protein
VEVKMVYTEYSTQGTESYGIMILAYDILHNQFSDINLECDIVFETCTEIMSYFFKSEEYINYNLSFYDALTLFVHNEYKEYFNEFER